MKKFFLLPVFIYIFSFTQAVFAESMYSPTWGFFIDLPEGYNFTDGDGKNRFSFSGPEGLMFDIIVYDNRFSTLLDLVEDANKKLTNQGAVDFFSYNGKQASIIQLIFSDHTGWGFAVELESAGVQRPMLLALSYSPKGKEGLELFHLSALDSISPSDAELRYPGPFTEYSYPRGEQRNVKITTGLNAKIYENDAEASQDLIEREFKILQSYIKSPLIQEASIRYYRFIFRDSYNRIKDAAGVIARNFGGHSNLNDAEKTVFAQRILSFVQGFKYERDFSGSDFLNLITAVTEGRGDCDSRAVLFAIILSNINIRSAIMLSYHYSHAMGLADIQGSGARVEALGTQWLVAETTAFVDIGMIAQDQSDPQHWFSILFE